MKKTVPDAETVCGHGSVYWVDEIGWHCRDCGQFATACGAEIVCGHPRNWSDQDLLWYCMDCGEPRGRFRDNEFVLTTTNWEPTGRVKYSRLPRGISVLISRALSPFKGKDSGA